MTTSPSKLDYALDAVRRGLPVFPQRGKIPTIRNWPANATLKESVVRRWWTRWPNADIGIALPADIYVLDADTPEARDVLYELTGARRLPRTLTVRTARGEHRYFRVPHALARQTPKPGATGFGMIEGKGSPGPVTWAGSVHPTGHIYHVYEEAPIATLPGAFVVELGPKRSQVNAGEATAAEAALWAQHHKDVTDHGAHHEGGWSREARDDARADLRLCTSALRSELPHMPSGWADRFFRAGAYLGPHVYSGGLAHDDAIEELTALFYELDSDGGPPEHVLRSIARGVAAGARQAGL